MQYSDFEIGYNIRHAKCPSKQIVIEAQLNDCSVEEIKEICGLRKAPEDNKYRGGPRPKYNWPPVEADLARGFSVQEVSKKHNIPCMAIYSRLNYRRRKALREGEEVDCNG